MRARNDRTLIIFGAVAVAALYGSYSLLSARTDHTDAYPPYSTYRADPQGLKALYDSLAEMPGLTVRRNHEPVTALTPNAPTTLLFVGDSLPASNEAPAEPIEAVEAFMGIGGRVVFTFPPGETAFWLRMRDNEEQRSDDEPAPEADDLQDEDAGDEDAEDGEAEEPKTVYDESWVDTRDVLDTEDDKEADEDEDETIYPYGEYTRVVNLGDRWGVDYTIHQLEQDETGDYKPGGARRAAGVTLPETQPWYSRLCFDNLSDDWRVIYERDGLPVIIERDYGKGTLVFCSDSYFLSNEALRDDPATELIAWLAGPHDTIVFDESHLGLVERGGVMKLAREYRLHGAILALILLAGLLIWQNAFSLAPPLPDPEDETLEGAEGREAIAGLQNLLARHVPQRDVIRTCVDEWKKDQPRGGSDVVAAVESRLAAEAHRGATHPVALYRALAEEARARRNRVMRPTENAPGQSKPAG